MVQPANLVRIGMYGEIKGYFMDVRRALHGECFYGMIYEEVEHKPLMEKAKGYLSDVKRLIGLEKL